MARARVWFLCLLPWVSAWGQVPSNIDFAVDLAFPNRDELILRVVNREPREIECTVQVKVQVEVNGVALSQMGLSQVLYVKAGSEKKVSLGKGALLELNLVNPQFAGVQLLSDSRNCSYPMLGLLKVFPQSHGSFVLATAISPDGLTVLTGGADRFARLWRIDTGEPIFSFEQTTNPLTSSVAAVAFSPGGTLAATGGKSEISLWDLSSGKRIGRYPSTDNGYFYTLDFSKDSRTLVTKSSDPAQKKVLIFDLLSKKFTPVLNIASHVRSIKYFSDGRRVLMYTALGGLEIWDLSTGIHLKRFVGPGSAGSQIHLAPDEKTFFAIYPQQNRVVQFDIESAQIKRTVLLPTTKLFEGLFLLSSDGKRLVYQERVGAQQIVCVLDVATGAKTFQFLVGENINNPPLRGALSPDARKMVVGMSDGTVRLYGLPAP